MRSQRFPATAEEFEALPRKLGWSYELRRGIVYVRPKHTVVVARIDTTSIAAREVDSVKARAVTDADLPAIVDLFTAAFENTAEYCDVEPEMVLSSAHECVRGYFDGARGEPLDVSLLAESIDATPSGAALVVRKPGGVVLDLLMVRPRLHRLGIASALVTAIARSLAALGETELFTCYRLANEGSVAFHHGYGFIDEPDLRLAIDRRDHAEGELRRRLRSGLVSDEERARLEARLRLRQGEVASFESIARQEGQEAVTPLLRLRRV